MDDWRTMIWPKVDCSLSSVRTKSTSRIAEPWQPYFTDASNWVGVKIFSVCTGAPCVARWASRSAAGCSLLLRERSSWRPRTSQTVRKKPCSAQRVAREKADLPSSSGTGYASTPVGFFVRIWDGAAVGVGMLMVLDRWGGSLWRTTGCFGTARASGQWVGALAVWERAGDGMVSTASVTVLVMHRPFSQTS